MASFKRLRVVNGSVRIGNDTRGRRGYGDNRQTLNTTGSYTFRSKDGTDFVGRIVATRGIPTFSANVHGVAVNIPITDVARSIKVDTETGRAQAAR